MQEIFNWKELPVGHNIKGILESADKFYKDIVATIRESLVVLDGSLRVVHANPTFYSTFQVDPQETEGHLLYELGNGQWDIPQLRQLLEEVLPKQAELRNFRVEHTFETIGRKVLLLNSRQIQGRDEGTDFILLAIEDITSHAQAEEEPAERTGLVQGYSCQGTQQQAGQDPETSLTQLTAVLEKMDAGILLVNSDGSTVLWANHQLGELFGIPNIGMAYGALPQTEDLIERCRAYLPSGNGTDPPTSQSFSGLLREMEVTGPVPKTVQQSTKPLFDTQGEYLGRLWTYEDVSERRKLEEQLILTQKMESLGLLVSSITHDFNNLLGGILGLSEMALREMPPEIDLAETVQQIQSAAGRGAGLVRQLSSFPQAQTSSTEQIDLNGVLTETCQLLRRLIGENIELVVVPEEGLDTVQADAAQLQQTIMNLALNARDAMPQGGTLTLETNSVNLDALQAQQYQCSPGRHVSIKVSDTGIGMTPETLSLSFDPFFTTKGASQGSGLGLHICYRIVRQTGGNIAVASRPGEGSTFTLFIPSVGQADSPESENPPSAPTATPTGDELVLVVDDEPVILNLVNHTLAGSGYHVLRATNGSEALALVQQYKDRPIDLVVTDMAMPLMGGVELAEQVRDIQPNTKFLFMSAYGDFIDQQRLGFFGGEFLAKPFMPSSLAAKVREVLDKTETA